MSQDQIQNQDWVKRNLIVIKDMWEKMKLVNILGVMQENIQKNLL